MVIAITEKETEKKVPLTFDASLGIPDRFAVLNRLITRDLNNNTSSPTFTLYSKDDIAGFLENPYRNSRQLRRAVTYIYGASSHFRRLIQYFASLSDLSYIISPYRIDAKTANPKPVGRNYRKVANVLSSMNLKTQGRDILTVSLREDTVYITMWVTADNITFQHLPPEYCDIATIEGGVPNVSFDFSYFDVNAAMLPFFPEEFTTKYNLYKRNSAGRWQELDSPTSFAVKCNSDFWTHPLPPFAPLLREIYDIEDYKGMKNTRTAIENYAMIAMTLGIDDEGNWLIDYDKAVQFYQNLDAVLPEEIGAVLTPMPINKISFERSNTSYVDTVAEAEDNLFTAAGVSSLLFNNEKASAQALLLSIKADQAITFNIVRGIENAINRYIQAQSYGKNFKVTFLDCSPYNRKEVGEAYLKATQFGYPMISHYCASQGLGPAELEGMTFLENDVLDLKSKFVPLQSSSTMSSSDKGAATDEGGAPTKEGTELSESGEESRERE